MFLSNVGYDFGCGTWGSGSILTLRWVSIFLALQSLPETHLPFLEDLSESEQWKSYFSGVAQIFTVAKILQQNPKMELYQEE